MNSSGLKRNGPEPIVSVICLKASVAAIRSGMMKPALPIEARAVNSSGKGFFNRKRRRESSSADNSSVAASNFWP